MPEVELMKARPSKPGKPVGSDGDPLAPYHRCKTSAAWCWAWTAPASVENECQARQATKSKPGPPIAINETGAKR